MTLCSAITKDGSVRPTWSMTTSTRAWLLCLILSVEEYESSLGPLRPYLYRKLREELRNILKPYRLEETYDSERVWYPRESSL